MHMKKSKKIVLCVIMMMVSFLAIGVSAAGKNMEQAVTMAEDFSEQMKVHLTLVDNPYHRWNAKIACVGGNIRLDELGVDKCEFILEKRQDNSFNIRYEKSLIDRYVYYNPEKNLFELWGKKGRTSDDSYSYEFFDAGKNANGKQMYQIYNSKGGWVTIDELFTDHICKYCHVKLTVSKDRNNAVKWYIDAA